MTFYKTTANGDERDRLLLARGKRIYQELVGSNRDNVAAALKEFAYALSANNRRAIHLLRQQLAEIFDAYEEYLDE